MKLKDKIKRWLGISDLKENNKDIYKKLDEIYGYIYKNANNIERINRKTNNNFEAINVLHSTIENVVHIGTDVRENRYNDTHSWAVICIEGKINIVKFVDLNRQDAREILNFLKHFEGGRHCIDSPSPLLFDQLFKF